MVTVAGELDAATAIPLTAFLTAEIDGSERDLVLDLRRLDFLGAAGLTAILVARSALRTGGREITVLCDRPWVRRLFLMCDLDGIVGLHPVAATG